MAQWSFLNITAEVYCTIFAKNPSKLLIIHDSFFPLSSSLTQIVRNNKGRPISPESRSRLKKTQNARQPSTAKLRPVRKFSPLLDAYALFPSIHVNDARLPRRQKCVRRETDDAVMIGCGNEFLTLFLRKN